MKKNKKKVLSLLLSVSLLISTKFVLKKPDTFMTNLYYGIDENDEHIEKIIDYEESDSIKYVGRYVPQGLCIIDNKVIISLYDSLCFSDSILYIYDTNNKIYSKVCLDMTAHTGGIAYDESNQLLWITARDGNLRYYDINDLDNNEIKSVAGDIYVGNELINHKGICSAAYMCINDDKLYVGNYVLRGNGVLKEYEIVNNDGIITLKYIKKYIAPSKTQGICFYDIDDKEYILFSRSYGNEVNSLLQIYEFSEEFDANLSSSINYFFNPMMEQICIDDEKLIGIFEYNSNVYRNDLKKDDLISVDINKLIKKNEN